MMNIGFLTSMKYDSYSCVIFHDVDMLLEDDRHIYRCSDNIRHMGVNVDKFNYTYVYSDAVKQSNWNAVAVFLSKGCSCKFQLHLNDADKHSSVGPPP